VTAAQHGKSTAEPIALRERASATPRGPERASRKPAEPSIAPSPGARVLTLAAQQAWFAQAVMTPESEAAPVGSAAAASILTPGPTLDPLSRLEIYRSAYHARLIECLLDDYPAVAATLGEEGFEALCRKYILVHPSTGPSLNSFGRHMEPLCRMEAAEPSALASRALAAFVADLAALEWAIVDVIHGASADPLTMATLATIPPDRWGDAKLVATPAFRLLRFDHPANRYFQAFREALDPAVPTPERSAVAVYRSGPTIWRMDLSDAAFDLLHALTSGRSLAAALDGASSALSGIDESEAAGRVSAWFRDWVSSGLFSGVELG
jgi:putative DNA-binding protein